MAYQLTCFGTRTGKADAARFYEAFAFGDSEALADELASEDRHKLKYAGPLYFDWDGSDMVELEIGAQQTLNSAPQGSGLKLTDLENARKNNSSQFRAAFLAARGGEFGALVTSAAIGVDAATINALPNLRVI